MEPDFSSEEPIVSGRVGSSSEDDFEDVPNVFADTCSITFEHTGLPNVDDHAIKLEFVKRAVTDMGIGPERITFPDPSIGETKTKTITIGVGEEYFCATQNLIAQRSYTNHIVSYPVTDKINYLFGHLQRERLTLAQCREDINLGGEPTPVDPPSDTIQIQYDMIGGGQGGQGKGFVDEGIDLSLIHI